MTALGAKVLIGRSRFLASIALVVAFQFPSAESYAQSGAQAIFGIVGEMMAAAQAQAAQEAWSKQSDLQQYCFQSALARHNTTVAALIRSGVMPGDPRLSSVATECARFNPRVLRAGYRCSVPDESGSPVTSICNQRFARQDSFGRPQVLDPRAAIDLYFSNGSYFLADVEDEAGRQERYQRIEGQRRIADLTQLRSDIEPYRTSRSNRVRAQTQSLIQRVTAASNPSTPPSPMTVDAIRRDYQLLVQLEPIEIARLAALDKLDSVKTSVERRATSGLAQDVRDELARLQGEYAAIVNQSASTPPLSPKRHRAVGPSFDCIKAKTSLDKVICSDLALSRLDLELVQPYYVLRHLTPDQRPALKQEAIDLSKRVYEQCRLPENGTVSAPVIKKVVPCVMAEYRRQRDRWRAQAEREASVAAQQEIGHPVEEHQRLQQLLQTAGFIDSGDQADGVYGTATRTAISSFQASESLPVDGILSNLVAERLARRAALAAPVSERVTLEQSATDRIADLHRRYLALASRLDDLDAKRIRDEQLGAKIAAGKEFANDALALTLPTHIKSALSRFVEELDSAGVPPEGTALVRLASDLDAIRPAAEEAVALAKATTSKNSFIVQGALDDVFVLFNDTGKAPSIAKNLRGDLVFESSKTVVCQPNSGLTDVTVSRQVNARLSKWGQSLKLPLPRCNLRNLTGYDLVVISRGDLLKEKASDVIALLSAVDSGAFASMISITGDEVKAAVQAEAVRVMEIENAVERGPKPGFGMVVLPAGSGVVCQVINDREAHETLTAPYTGRLAEETRNIPTFVTTSADAAFVAAKRGQCGVIYASGNDLKDLTPALRRDQITFRYLPIWIEPEEVAKARQVIAEGKAKDLQQEADRRRRIEDEQRLAAVRANDEAVVKARQQAELQQQYGAMARAFEGLLTIEMKEFVEGRSPRAGAKYPMIRAWFDEQVQDRWELMTVETFLLDYGVSEFKGRSLETAFAKTFVKMRNRVLGEYKEHCFITGFISDTEFAMEREPVSARCETGSDTILAYRQGQRFTSRWLGNVTP